MERWNELIAGYVLGNLTDEEQRELSEVLAENPQLKLEIARLRKTATMSHTQVLDWSLSYLEAGAEGWADSVDDFPDLMSGKANSPVFQAMTAAAVDSQADSQSAEPVLPHKALPRKVLPRKVLPHKIELLRYFGLSTRKKLRPQNLLLWMMSLLLLYIAIDNCLTRRMLMSAQERILHLESLIEPTSNGASLAEPTD